MPTACLFLAHVVGPMLERPRKERTRLWCGTKLASQPRKERFALSCIMLVRFPLYGYSLAIRARTRLSHRIGSLPSRRNRNVRFERRSVGRFASIEQYVELFADPTDFESGAARRSHVRASSAPQQQRTRSSDPPGEQQKILRCSTSSLRRLNSERPYGPRASDLQSAAEALQKGGFKTTITSQGVIADAPQQTVERFFRLHLQTHPRSQAVRALTDRLQPIARRRFRQCYRSFTRRSRPSRPFRWRSRCT